MRLFKSLNILAFSTLMIFFSLSCETKDDNPQNISTDTTGQRLHLLQKIFWDSLPQPTGYVSDFENIYSDKEKRILDSLISNFEKRTTIQIALVTFSENMTNRENIDTLAFRLLNHWGVGQKEKNNGIVVGISKSYKRMRIENGYGIGKIMSDTETKTIIDSVFIPRFREEKYFEGTLNGLKAIMTNLEKKLQD